MSQEKVQLNIVFTAPADQVAEGDRIFNSHAKWIKESHPREGKKALLHYTVAKGSELTNPLDPSSAPTGNTTFVVSEIYESMDGVDNHWQLGMNTWSDFQAMGEWAGNCKVTVLHGTPVVHTL